MASPENPILFFDGVCNLCNGTVRFLLKHDRKGKLRFASLQSPLGQAVLRSLNMPLDPPPTAILLEGKEPSLRSTAALRTTRSLDWPWKMLYVFIAVPKPLRDYFYDRIAESRYRIFGRQETCMLPSRENRDRFLS